MPLAGSADKLVNSGRANYPPYKLAWLLMKLSANCEQGWKSVLLHLFASVKGSEILAGLALLRMFPATATPALTAMVNPFATFNQVTYNLRHSGQGSFVHAVLKRRDPLTNCRRQINRLLVRTVPDLARPRYALILWLLFLRSKALAAFVLRNLKRMRDSGGSVAGAILDICESYRGGSPNRYIESIFFAQVRRKN